MAFTTRLLAGALVMAATVTLSGSASAQSPVIEVRIQDRVTLSAALLGDVKTKVTRIFSDAGVTTVWDGRPEFTIFIVSAEMAARMHQSPERMGFTPAG